MLFKYIAGNNVNSAIIKSKILINSNKIPIINYINENNNDALKNYNSYNDLINNIVKNIKNINNDKIMIALKFSSLNFDKKLIDDLINNAIKNNIIIVTDAEANKNINEYRLFANELIYKYNRDYPYIYKTYQMYRKDSYDELKDDSQFFYQNSKKLATKIVRGAYYNSEKRENHLFKYKGLTDNNYNYALKLCFNNNLNNNIIATHNADSIVIANKLNKKRNIFIIANLMGMNENNMNIIKNKYNTQLATYVPYGPYKEMLPYLTRRLYENIDQIKYFFK